MNEEHLSEEEKKLFRQLQTEKPTSPALEDQIVNALKQEGLINDNQRRLPWVQWAAAAAIAVVFFFVGQYTQTGKADVLEINPEMGYMLLLHETESFQPGDPMDMFNEYKTWMEGTFAKGVTITGQELDNKAVFVGPSDSLDYQSAFKPHLTTGYFVLEAESLEQAIEVAQENPHIKYGGRIEVKPFIVR